MYIIFVSNLCRSQGWKHALDAGTTKDLRRELGIPLATKTFHRRHVDEGYMGETRTIAEWEMVLDFDR